MKITLGDLYSLKNHPYSGEFTNIKISGLASMTPPILVVSEILNIPKQHDTETGKVKSGQVKCIFYSHKSHQFEDVWISINDIKPLAQKKVEESAGEQVNHEIPTADFLLGKYSNPGAIEEIRKEFLNAQVILKSCDLELGKLKTTFSQTENKPADKVTAHLDFLPPVLTVIDVKINEEKHSYNPKSGNLRKLFSTYLLKCKWFNPISGSFSEYLLPLDAVKKIIPVDITQMKEAIKEKQIFRHDLNKDILVESKKSISHTYIQPLEIIFNHYVHQIRYYDIFRNRYSKIDVSAVVFEQRERLKRDDLILEKFPEYKKEIEDYSKLRDIPFKINQFYRITYRDLHGTITKRIIYLKEFVPNKILIADCFLRNGEERHFRLDENALLKLEVLNQNFFI